MLDWRARAVFLAGALIGLMVGIDGALKEEWARSLAGWAAAAALSWIAFPGISRFNTRLDRELAEVSASPTWTFEIAGALFALVCLAGAAALLFAPFEYLSDWTQTRRGNFIAGLAAVIGETGARLVLAPLFLFAAWAASRGLWNRLRGLAS